MSQERNSIIFTSTIKFVDAIAYAPNDPQKEDHPKKLLLTALDPRLSKRQRFLAGVHLVDSVVPIEESLAAKVIGSQKLPFTDESPKLFALGCEHSVFLIETPNARHVLKIDRSSIGLDNESLKQKAQEVKSEYQMIKNWFEEVPDLIPNEEVIITQSHLMQKPAIGIIQPYFPDGKDFFVDYSKEELVRLLRQKAHLRKTFLGFARKFMDLKNNDQLSVDIIGDKNLAVLADNKLVFLDPHVIYHLDKNEPDRNVGPLLTKRTQEISEILEAVT